MQWQPTGSYWQGNPVYIDRAAGEVALEIIQEGRLVDPPASVSAALLLAQGLAPGVSIGATLVNLQGERNANTIQPLREGGEVTEAAAPAPGGVGRAAQAVVEVDVRS